MDHALLQAAQHRLEDAAADLHNVYLEYMRYVKEDNSERISSTLLKALEGGDILKDASTLAFAIVNSDEESRCNPSKAREFMTSLLGLFRFALRIGGEIAVPVPIHLILFSSQSPAHPQRWLSGVL